MIRNIVIFLVALITGFGVVAVEAKPKSAFQQSLMSWTRMAPWLVAGPAVVRTHIVVVRRPSIFSVTSALT